MGEHDRAGRDVDGERGGSTERERRRGERLRRASARARRPGRRRRRGRRTHDRDDRQQERRGLSRWSTVNGDRDGAPAPGERLRRARHPEVDDVALDRAIRRLPRPPGRSPGTKTRVPSGITVGSTAITPIPTGRPLAVLPEQVVRDRIDDERARAARAGVAGAGAVAVVGRRCSASEPRGRVDSAGGRGGEVGRTSALPARAAPRGRSAAARSGLPAGECVATVRRRSETAAAKRSAPARAASRGAVEPVALRRPDRPGARSSRRARLGRLPRASRSFWAVARERPSIPAIDLVERGGAEDHGDRVGLALDVEVAQQRRDPSLRCGRASGGRSRSRLRALASSRASSGRAVLRAGRARRGRARALPPPHRAAGAPTTRTARECCRPAGPARSRRLPARPRVDRCRYR